MGIFKTAIKFKYPAPRPNEIVEKASEISDLTVRFISKGEENPDWKEFSGKIFFDAFPEQFVDIYAYKMDAIKEREEKSECPSSIKSEGFYDCDGVQRIYVKGYLELESTLSGIIHLALLKLGGESNRKDDEYYFAEYDRKITVDELNQRIQKNKEFVKKTRPWHVLGSFLSIFVIPVYVVLKIIIFPFRLLRDYLKKSKT
ncbi:MAG: hypothetical protein KC618_00185 [Candidatus Omnitrophica bacterium]|nr:hypothetical protein [Candidatus Omnitrophota bacterium]